MTERPLDLDLAAELSEVSCARRWARAQLAHDDRSEDVQLIVTELVTNAVLHGAPPVRLRLVQLDDVIRVEVRDAGRRTPVRVASGDSGMTGRGLALVARLSSQWGVEPDSTGKVVYAYVAGGKTPALQVDGELDVDLDAFLEQWEDELDEPRFPVELGDVPTALLVDAKAHIDNIVRELTLEAAGADAADRPLPPALARLVAVVTGTFADARAQLKRQAMAAAAEGRELTHLSVRLPASAADAGEQYLRALDEVDEYARAAQLLTLETPAVHSVFRRWYIDALVEQLRAVSAGRARPRTPALIERLAAEVTELAPLRETARQLAVLQQVTARLAAAGESAEVAATVTGAAVHVIGAHAARLYLLDGDVLRLTAAAGGGDAQLSEPYDTIPADSDLPGGVALRTGAPVIARNRTDLARQFPALAGVYRDERSLLVAPLLSAARRLGVLAMTFRGESRIDEQTQRTFLTTLADVTAQALLRAAATTTADTALQRLTFLAEASAVLSAKQDALEVLDALAGLAVPRLADWVVIELLEGERLVAVSAAHTDPAKAHWARQMAERWPVDMTADAGSPSVTRTGVSQRLEHVDDDVLRAVAVDDEHLAVLRDLGMTSALIVPLTGRGGTYGAITMIYAESGRRYDSQDEQLAGDLAHRAALALEAARSPSSG